MVTNPVNPADVEKRQVPQPKPQQDQLESATQYYFQQTEGMPQSVMSGDDRGVLADARARNEVFGEEMPDSSVALLEKAADAVEQDSFAYFSQQGGLPEDIADWASETQKRIFLGDKLPESDESKLEGVKLAALVDAEKSQKSWLV